MSTPLDRGLFPVTEHFNYLNHAAVGILPVPTRDALTRFVYAHSTEGISGVFPYELRLPEYRSAIARYIGAAPSEIAILRNTGDGANAIATGLDWKPGDEIVLSDNEFPANAYPWLACRDFGVVVRLIEGPRQRMTPAVLRANLTKRTRIVAVSWVAFHDGYRHDLAALAEVAHEFGALLCVDVMQGLGAFRLDVHASGIDAAYGGGAKWLMALQGVSFLYVREGLIERLRLAAPGWRSAQDMWAFFDYDQPLVYDASRFEGGTVNIIGALSLAESVRVLDEPGDAVAKHVLMLTDRLCDGLHRVGGAITTTRQAGISSGIVTFNMPACDPIALGKILQQERIVTTYRSNGIRVSPHGYNTEAEIDHLVETTARAVPVLATA